MAMKVYAVVVAHFAEGDEVGLEPHEFVDDGVVTAFYLGSLLPDVPLQNRDVGRAATEGGQ